MAGDADFDKVALLLHMDGADGSTTFNDRSPTAKAIAASGNAKVSAAAAYALSGTVTGSTGSPVARAIRAIREDTGAYVGGVISNATTGAYTISTEHPGEHTVVVYPVTGENLPALVHHGVIPI